MCNICNKIHYFNLFNKYHIIIKMRVINKVSLIPKCLSIMSFFFQKKNFEVDRELKKISKECMQEWIKAFVREALRICVQQKKLHMYPDFLKSSR